MKAWILMGAYLNRLKISEDHKKDLNLILGKLDSMVSYIEKVAAEITIFSMI